jgi:hypothetical protein
VAIIVPIVVAWRVAITSRTSKRVPTTMIETLEVAHAAPLPVDELAPEVRRLGAWLYFGMLAVYGALIQLTDVTKH